MASSSSSSSSSRNWEYDVFPSFSGEDIRKNFLSHFLKEFDRKLIIAFKDNEIKRSQSLDPELKKAIRTSRIALVVFSPNYASSSWCLNELLEIVKCKEEFGQMVIPVFYGLDPSDVRKQTGKFGEAFLKTCQNQTEEKSKLWRRTLTDVANILGYHSQNCESEAILIEDITNDVLEKLLLVTFKDYEGFVGIKKHIEDMSVLLQLESEEVRMVGIWGSSGIGKTTIARALYCRLSPRFQSSIFIDMAFISKSMGFYKGANPFDGNMKLHLQKAFLSKILDKKDIKIDRLGAVEERLKHQKVLIFIDDVKDQVLLDALVGQKHWFGNGSRIIVITKDKHHLRAHGIDHIYKVGLPSKKLALEMFCRSAFRKNTPPDGFMELASKVCLCAGKLPLGLTVLGSYLRGRDKEAWMKMFPSLCDSLNGTIENTLRVCYKGLKNRKDEAIFRHIACLFNGAKISHIKQMISYSDSDVKIGLKNLIDKSLIYVRNNSVYMHCLIQEMGKEIVRAQSEDQPEEREFLVDSEDICYVLEDDIGTEKVLGVSLNTDEIDGLHIHKDAFKGMSNLHYLEIYSKEWYKEKEFRWYLQKGFNYLPPKLRLLRLDGYPMRYMPSNFSPVNLVKLHMQGNKLETLWEGTHALRGLKDIDLQGSINLKEIPDLSMATNLQKLNLYECSSLVELPSSIQYLNKLKDLNMEGCKDLVTLPTGINLLSLKILNLDGCSKLRMFPDISTNVSNLSLNETGIEVFPFDMPLEKLITLSMCRIKSVISWEIVQPLAPVMTMLSHSLTRLIISDIPSLVELPSSIQNFYKLERLFITECVNLETLPTGINLPYLRELYLMGCTRLKTFPDISTHIKSLYLARTGLGEVPWWIEKFSRLRTLGMSECNNLQCVSLNISKLNHLEEIDFSNCSALTEVTWNDNQAVVAMTNIIGFEECDDSDPESDQDCDLDNKIDFNEDSDDTNAGSGTHFSQMFEEQFPWLLDNFQMVELNFSKCLKLDQEALLREKSNIVKLIKLSGEEVPSYFTHRTTGTSLTKIPLPHTLTSQPFFRFRACIVVDFESLPADSSCTFEVQVLCRFNDINGNDFESSYQQYMESSEYSHIIIFDCYFPLNEDNGALTGFSHYDSVDIQFQLTPDYYQLVLKGCGILICEDDVSSDDNGLGNETDYSEKYEDCNDSDLGNETDHSEEFEDSDVETKRKQ